MAVMHVVPASAPRRRRSAAKAAAGLATVALATWILWPQSGAGPDARTSSAREPAAATRATPARLSPSLIHGQDGDTSPAAAPAADGLVETEIHGTTFGDPPREVDIRRLANRKVEPPKSTERARTRAGQRIDLFLGEPSALREVVLEVPDPVPARIEVRVPARDDARLVEPVLLVVDAKTVKPLPGAYLDAASRAPEATPVRADDEGRI